MRVVHVVGSLDPCMGGLPRAVIGLASGLAGQGIGSVVLFCGESPSPSILREWSQGGEVPAGLTFMSVSRLYSPCRSRSIDTVLDSLQMDWLQVHGLWEPLLHAAMRWAGARGIPYGLTPHSMGHPWHNRRRVLLKALVKHPLGAQSLWKNATRLQALTRAEASHWRSVMDDPERIRVIANGIDPESDPGDSGTRRQEIPELPFLLFLGRLHAQKAPEVLLEAFVRISEAFPELHLVLAGPDYGLRRALEKLAQKSAVSDRIHFPGSLDGQAKWDALHRCRAFCLPSRAEGFSLALLEAGLAGVPCLISAECGFPELIEAGGAREITISPKALADELKTALAEPDALASLGVQARRLIREHYTWTRVAEEVAVMVQEVCGT